MEKIIEKLENLEIGKSVNLKYKRIRICVENNFGSINWELKPSITLYLISFFSVAIVFSSIGITVVAILTGGDEKLVGFGIIPMLIMLFFIKSISIALTKYFYRKDLKQFELLSKQIKMKTIANEINSTNPNFIEKLLEFRKEKLNPTIVDLRKVDLKENLELNLINEREYNYLIALLE